MKIYPTLEITVGTLFESVFIRDYTGKVDELIKDKIEAQKEVKAKQHEEKEVTELQLDLDPGWVQAYCKLLKMHSAAEHVCSATTCSANAGHGWYGNATNGQLSRISSLIQNLVVSWIHVAVGKGGDRSSINGIS
ncbi:hypothetical protein V6N13_142796 [Hibiscus sabdariffa]